MFKFLALFVLIALFTISSFSSDILPNFQMEKNPHKKELRQQWIDQMNRIEPDLDWRIIQSEILNAKSIYRQDKLIQMLEHKNYEQILADEETIADGIIRGKWIERGSKNQAGRIHTADIDFQRNIIIAASSGGNIWQGTLNGKNWQCLNDRMNFYDIRTVKFLKKTQQNRIIVVRNSPASVVYSDNNGELWETAKGLEIPANWGWMKRGAVLDNEKNTTFILVQEFDYDLWQPLTSIYISNDFCESFKRIYSTYLSVNVLDIWAPQYGSDKCYLATPDDLYVFNSNGDTISRESLEFNPPGETTDIYQILLAGSFNDLDSVICIMQNRNTKQGRVSSFFKHYLRGQTEFESEIMANPFQDNSLAMSNLSSKKLFFGSVNMYRNINDDHNWETVNEWYDYYPEPLTKLHADICGISLFVNPDKPDEEIMLIATDGGLYISKNYSIDVTNISLNNLNVSQYYSTYSYPPNPQIIFAGSQDQGFQRAIYHNDNTLEFEQTISGDYGHLCSSDRGTHLWSVYPGWALLYKDIAKDDHTAAGWTFDGTGWLWMPPIIADPDNPKAAYVAAGGKNGSSNLWRLDFDGVNINGKMLDYNFKADDPNANLSAIAFSPVKTNYLYAMDGLGRFYTSSNKGIDWTISQDFQGPQPHYFYGNSIVPSQIDFGTVFIGGSGYSNPGSYLSKDNGDTFQPIDDGLPKTLILDMAISDDEQFLFAATQVGPYVYVVKVNKWYDMSGMGAPDQTYWSVEYVPQLKTVRFGTYGRGIWDFKITGISSVETKEASSIAQKINVVAYPNPSKEATTIEIDLPESGLITVNIYDLQGHIVANLFDGIMPSGKNVLKWDGTSKSGTSLPRGNYICTASGFNNCSFVKLILE